MINIRPYRNEDYEDLKLNLQEGGLFNVTIDDRETLRAKIQSNPESILVATIDNKVVGNVYIIQDPWSSFIFRLAVRKKFKERGVGAMLMGEAEELLREKGVKDVALFVRSNHNELINYYKKMGYTSMENLHQCMYKEL